MHCRKMRVATQTAGSAHTPPPAHSPSGKGPAGGKWEEGEGGNSDEERIEKNGRIYIQNK